ncbi:spore germination protein [Bacillus sp. JJ722]|uniref:spore germination protein n=1 Tax=Bacillus sp. JJ722 TaxID=3122973 RepID=UPI002FFFBAB1
MPNYDLKRDVHQSIAYLKHKLADQEDVIFKEIQIPKFNCSCFAVYLQERVNFQAFSNIILNLVSASDGTKEEHSLEEIIISKISPYSDQNVYSYSEIINQLFRGNLILLVDGFARAYVLKLAEKKLRTFSEPTTEQVIRGPKIGFIESLEDNIGLIRQLSNHPNLIVKFKNTGTIEKKRLAILYIKDVAQESLIQEVNKRINKILTKDFQDSGMVEDLIQDQIYSVFPQTQNTERVDRVLASLTSGKVVLLLDGSPFAIIAPTSLITLMEAADDYYNRWISGTFIRFLRYFAMFMTIFLTATYISLVSFNPGLLPTELAITIMGTRENIPFPPIFEALIMEITIELLRETGIRLPSPIGQIVGLVGGVVIGQAAVEANIVSSIMVIIVALTTITSFTLPQYNSVFSIRFLRFGAMLFASVFGVFGTTLYFIILTIHLAKLKSFNESYFEPSMFIEKKTWKDALIRFPRRN